ncbi:MAG: hypothetical protein R6U50_00105 [Desulfobacterales bacterium]
MSIVLPYPEDWRVKDIRILEKKDASKEVKVLLSVELIHENTIVKDICYLAGEIERERPKILDPWVNPTKTSHILPVRNRFDFDDENDAVTYIRTAFSELLLDNGYEIGDYPGTDLFGFIKKRRFFLMITPCCNEKASEKARKLIEFRKEHKHTHDYGLVVAAFQEPFGIPLSVQESWVMANMDKLASHRIGVYGVDNSDPNRIYPFTVYPQVHGLVRYFSASSRQWQDIRMQYVMARE